MKYVLSLARRFAVALVDATKTFAENETLAFGAFLTALATAGALKAAEAVGITLNATALGYVAIVAGSLAVVIIRQFVGSLAFVRKALGGDEPPADPGNG